MAFPLLIQKIITHRHNPLNLPFRWRPGMPAVHLVPNWGKMLSPEHRPLKKAHHILCVTKEPQHLMPWAEWLNWDCGPKLILDIILFKLLFGWTLFLDAKAPPSTYPRGLSVSGSVSDSFRFRRLLLNILLFWQWQWQWQWWLRNFTGSDSRATGYVKWVEL